MSKEYMQAPRSFKPDYAVESPFLSAKREWDDRMGALVLQARNWRLAFFSAAGALFVLAVGFVFFVQSRKIIPIMVGIDKERGEPVVIGEVGESAYQPKLQEIKYFLTQFITSVRSVSTDPVLVKQNWLKAYKFLRPEAANILNDLANRDVDSPLKRIGEDTVIVKPVAVVQVADGNSYQARWEENIYGKQGSLKEHYVMVAVFTVDLDPPKSEDTLLTNPLGLYIKNFQWNKEL